MEEAIKQADALACECLSQSWERSELAVKQYLMHWQSQLNTISPPSSLPDTEIEMLGDAAKNLNASMQHFALAFQSKNAVLLSHTLIKLWIPSLRTLTKYISAPSS